MIQRWFDRKFDFSFGMEKYPLLRERLQLAPSCYHEATASLHEPVLHIAPANRWSIKTHIGHLRILEPLWQRRFQDIANGMVTLSPADLNNAATHEADFDGMPLPELLADFEVERKKTLAILDRLTVDDFSKSSFHPRLRQPMRIIDLMYFIAEHDDHHLTTINELIKHVTIHHNE